MKLLIKDKLRETAKSVGIDKIGVTNDKKSGGTAIAALFPYFVANEHGNIAMYARGRDYHKVNAEKLKVLCEFLKNNGAKKFEIFVDNAARNDRKAANLAGLGFFGRNNLLICDEYGSYFTIGQIVTDLYIEPDSPDARECRSCGECEKACPSGALIDGKFDKALCISEISQKKGELNEGEKKILKFSGNIWGCDICQMPCRYNEGLKTTAPPELTQNRIANLTLQDIENLTDGEFRNKYGEYAFSWRGADILKRNLKI